MRFVSSRPAVNKQARVPCTGLSISAPRDGRSVGIDPTPAAPNTNIIALMDRCSAGFLRLVLAAAGPGGANSRPRGLAEEGDSPAAGDRRENNPSRVLRRGVILFMLMTTHPNNQRGHGTPREGSRDARSSVT